MADAEDKLINHLKIIWANDIALYTKVEGYSLMSQGPTMLANHHNYKRVAKKIAMNHHKIGHAIRYLNEVPPASIDRVTELNEIPDATEIPDAHELNIQLYKDFAIQIERIQKAIKRAHDVEQFGISSILGKYMKMLQHYSWHALAATEYVAPGPDEDESALGDPAEHRPEEL